MTTTPHYPHQDPTEALRAFGRPDLADAFATIVGRPVASASAAVAFVAPLPDEDRATLADPTRSDAERFAAKVRLGMLAA